jgi:hypothetical protein
VPDDTNVTLVLNWYEKSGSDLIGEETVDDLSLDEILGLFEAPFWNKNFQCWAIEDMHVSALQPHVRHPINTKKFAYFIEAYTAR